ncbi:acetate--CoA ligase [Halospeciosus flavus]|uniref:Acetate--CoA ligase n=1 Tax=Halospeciosus flavus TaxID=3032283 RepID=A0ABD5Z809_9EURY|nr:acetate--CoA ligase [Halospeciosus flavus]
MDDARFPQLRSPAADEERLPPPASFVEQANVTDESIRREFEQNWPACWKRAATLLDWSTPYDRVLDTDDGYTWFDGGSLNAAYNCVDRHLEAGRKNQAAIKWEGKLGETRTYTYQDLSREVNALAAALRDLGVEADDVVTVYMPMIPELPITMLACARIGAVHSVVFAGFSGDALATRMENSNSEYLLTCDGYYRRGTAYDLKSKADNACLAVPQSVEQVVVDRLGDDRSLGDDYHDYGDLVADHEGADVDPVARDADDDLFLIYTSGTTGQPKAVRHTTGGYLSHVAWTSHAVLDLEPDDTHWCSADVGWITGHSYIVYGPLALGATTVMYEGTPDHPERDRLWEIVERNAVDVFYTAPTAIRAFMKWGSEHPDSHDLSSLRLLGTVGEPIDETAWRWYYEHIGDEECPIVDTWWQTETGGVLLSTLPGVDPMRPGAAGPALPGVEADVVDATGKSVDPGESGSLVVTRPWPGMAASLCEGADPGADSPVTHGTGGWTYRTGDSARVDRDGYIHLLGREGDVINVAGHRLGTTELESAIVGVDGVAEAAVVGGDHDLKGTEVYAYVSPRKNVSATEPLRERVREAVADAIGPFATPDTVVFTPDLPKTRSGKVMRRYLERITNGEELSDTSALRNPEIVGELESIVEDISD